MMRIELLSRLAAVDLSNVDKKSKEGEHPVRLCNFVDVYHNWAITKRMYPNLMTSTANENQLSRFTIKKGQVAITKDSETRDDIGIPTYMADDFDDVVLGYHCALITPKDGILSGAYLNVVLHSPYASKYFEANASGSGQRYTLTSEIIGNFPVPLIPYEEQLKIAAVFETIDRKIENNNSIIFELESMAKDIYDYWFVQFDFPDENGKPYKSSGGKMVWNEELKREIPDGWGVKDLCDVFYVTMGSSPEGETINEMGNGIVFYQGRADFGVRYPSQRTFTTAPKRYAKPEDVLLSVRAPVGDINRALQQCCIGRGVAAIHSEWPSYAYYSCLFLRPRFAKYNDGGTTFGCINGDDLSRIPIVMPDETTIKRFEHKVALVDSRIRVAFEENVQLASLRDWLLPMLMSGQVKVGGVA